MDYSQISQNDVDGFRANLNMVPQVTESVYIPHVDADLAYGEPGKLFNADDIGKSDPKDVDTVVPDSPEGLVDQMRRVGAFKGWHDGKFIESVQKLQQLVDPTNEVMKAMRAGMHRKMDKTIRDSFFAPVRVGETGEGSLNFDTTNRIIDAASRKFLHQAEVPGLPETGDLPLTVGKLNVARGMLKKGRVEGKLKLALRQNDISQLLSTTPATSADYATIKRVENGELSVLFGFELVWDEDVNEKVGEAGTFILPAWVDGAMVYKARDVHTATLGPRADKSYRPYAYYEKQDGALRRYDEGVVGIEVKDL